jgi:hypothetical protein
VLIRLFRAVLEDFRFADGAADPKGDQSHRTCYDEASTPPPGLHPFIVRKECQDKPD